MTRVGERLIAGVRADRVFVGDAIAETKMFDASQMREAVRAHDVLEIVRRKMSFGRWFKTGENKDVERFLKSIDAGDTFEIEAAWEKVERWL